MKPKILKVKEDYLVIELRITQMIYVMVGVSKTKGKLTSFRSIQAVLGVKWLNL